MSLGNATYNIKSPLKVDGYVELKNMSSTPSAGGDNSKLFVKEDDLYLLSPTGTEKKMGIDAETLDKINDLSQNGVGGNVVNIENSDITIMPHDEILKMTALYDFDNCIIDGIAKDNSIYKNHSLAITKSPTIIMDAKLNRNVASFDGSTMFVPLGSNSILKSSKVSIFAYASNDNWSTLNGKVAGLVSSLQNGGVGLCTNNDNMNAYCYVDGKYYIIPYLLDNLSGGWHIFSLTYDGYILSFYIDDILVNTMETSSTIEKPISYVSNGIFIGAEAYTSVSNPEGGKYFKGEVAEVRIYNDGLSKEDVFKVNKAIRNHERFTQGQNININGDYVTNNSYSINDVTNPLAMNPLEYGKIEYIVKTSYDGQMLIPTSIVGNMEYFENNGLLLRVGSTYVVTGEISLAQDIQSDIVVKIMQDNLSLVWLIEKSQSNSTHNYTSHNFNQISTTQEKDAYLNCKWGYCNNIGTDVKVTLQIQEIRNNPVAQYGGFETEILFDGNANTENSYVLSDDITNYDFIYIHCNTLNQSNLTNPVLGESKIISKLDFMYGKSNSYIINSATTNTGMRYMICGFLDTKTFVIGGIIKSSTDTELSVRRIIGIKGQLPSLLVGGEF